MSDEIINNTTPAADTTDATATPIVAVVDAVQEIPAEGEHQVEAAPAIEDEVSAETVTEEVTPATTEAASAE